MSRRRATRYGSVLHEAGHLAIVPARFREYVRPASVESPEFLAAVDAYMRSKECFDNGPDHSLIRGLIQAGDCEASAWSYAAAHEIGLDTRRTFDYRYPGNVPKEHQPYDGEQLASAPAASGRVCVSGSTTRRIAVTAQQDLELALKIASVVLRFGEIERATGHPDGRWETNTTHTVMLALLAGALAERHGEDPFGAVLLALVHDLVEYHTGDVNTAFGLSVQEQKKKRANEREALEELCEVFGEGSIISVCLRAYAEAGNASAPPRQVTAQVRAEGRAVDLVAQVMTARYVKVLDKVTPKLTNTLDSGAALRRIGMSPERLHERHIEQRASLAERFPELPNVHDLLALACDASEGAYTKAAPATRRPPTLSELAETVKEQTDAQTGLGFRPMGAEACARAIRSELVEAEDASEADLLGEVGDLLYITIKYAQTRGVDPARALQATCTKIQRRLEFVEEHRNTGLPAEELWRRAKASRLCPVCGETVTLAGETDDGRVYATCGDAFTREQWDAPS